MNRKELRGGGSRRGNDTDVRRKEKENRKLQLELRSEKEKLNSTIIKYQREYNDMQAVSNTKPPTNQNTTAEEQRSGGWIQHNLTLTPYLTKANINIVDGGWPIQRICP